MANFIRKTISMTPDTEVLLHKMAEERHQTMSQIVRDALQAYSFTPPRTSSHEGK
jgi:hypothetical protein